MNRKLEFTVPEEYEGKKAFYFLRGCAGISARALSSLKRVDGGITRGGETLRTIDRLHAGDIVTMTLPVETETVEPMDINIDVIYEDADLLAVNKSPFSRCTRPITIRATRSQTQSPGICKARGRAQCSAASAGSTKAHRALLSAP